MIVIAFEVNEDEKRCKFKFVNTFERIDDVIFTRGDNVTFGNWCKELEEHIIHSQICDDDDLELFGPTDADLKGRIIKEIGLTKEGCIRFGLKHC